MTAAHKPNVLFLCTGNSARSQMAEAILRNTAGDRFVAMSAGLEPKDINPLTIRVLSEAGISTEGLHSKSSDEFLGKGPIRYAVIVCDRAHQQCPLIYPFATQTLYWPFDDPAAASGSEEDRLGVFRRVRNEIQRRIETWLPESM